MHLFEGPDWGHSMIYYDEKSERKDRKRNKLCTRLDLNPRPHDHKSRGECSTTALQPLPWATKVNLWTPFFPEPEFFHEPSVRDWPLLHEEARVGVGGRQDRHHRHLQLRAGGARRRRLRSAAGSRRQSSYSYLIKIHIEVFDVRW